MFIIYLIDNFDLLKYGYGSCKYDPKHVVLNISRWNYVSCDFDRKCSHNDEKSMARAVNYAPIVAYIYASWFVNSWELIYVPLYGYKNLKKTSKFSPSFKNYDGGFYQDEKCCSNKKRWIRIMVFQLYIFLNSGPSGLRIDFSQRFFCILKCLTRDRVTSG